MMRDTIALADGRIVTVPNAMRPDIPAAAKAVRAYVAGVRRRAAGERELRRLSPWLKADIGLCAPGERDGDQNLPRLLSNQPGYNGRLR